MTAKNNRKKGGGGGEGGSSFVVLFTSLSVILLAFFILLNTMATVDSERVRKALGSLVGGFGILPGGFVLDNMKGALFFSTPAGVEKKGFKDTMADLERAILKLEMEDDASIQKDDQEVVITFNNKVMFTSGGVNMNPAAYKIMDKIALLIESCKNKVRIEGHTDDIPVRNGKYFSNWGLSTARAVAVLKYLMNKGKIPPDRLSAEGYGEYHPIVENNSEENRAKNRRVNIIFVGRIQEVEDGKKKR